MADISRAMQTPPPGTIVPAGWTPPPTAADPSRAAKNERDRLRRKAKRAADAKAAKLAAAKPKKKKAKAKKRQAVSQARINAAMAPKKRGRGRPPGARNKPKDANDILAPLTAAKPAAVAKSASLLTQIGAAVTLLNAMPEHARKVVLDAVK